MSSTAVAPSARESGLEVVGLARARPAAGDEDAGVASSGGGRITVQPVRPSVSLQLADREAVGKRHPVRTPAGTGVAAQRAAFARARLRRRFGRLRSFTWQSGQK